MTNSWLDHDCMHEEGMSMTKPMTKPMTERSIRWEVALDVSDDVDLRSR